MVMSPQFALGQAVHEVVEGLSLLPTKERFNKKLVPEFERVWEKFSGKNGGFFDIETEFKVKERGIAMVRRVETNPGPLANLAVKLNMDLPYYFLSEPDNIILCGKIDWMEYLPETDSLHIIDFKTGKVGERDDSFQLPIYVLLARNLQKRAVEKVSYWYLEYEDSVKEKEIPDIDLVEKEILNVGKRMKAARSLGRFDCPKGGCRYCEEMERVVAGEAEYVGVGGFGKDVYVLRPRETEVTSTII